MSEKKKNRRSYLNDFQKGINGEYSYKGAVFEANAPYAEYKKTLALWFIALAATVACGCLPAKGMTGAFYILIPYLAEVLLGAAGCFMAVRLLRAEYPLREYVYKKTAAPMPVIAIAASVSSAARLAAYTVFCIVNAAEVFPAEIVYYIILNILDLATIAATAALYARVRKVKFTKISSRNDAEE